MGTKSVKTLIITALCVFLSNALGCGEEVESSAPEEEVTPLETTPESAEVEAPPEEPEHVLPEGVDHTVQPGESLWAIARAYNVTVDAVMQANQLSRRDVRRIREGQTLRIPGATETLNVAETNEAAEELPPVEDGAYHRLAEGETLWDVARLYEMSIDDVMQRNELDEEAVRRLRPGRALVIPGATPRQVERVTRNRERLLAERNAGRVRGFRHRVQRGETIWDLAGAFGVTVAEIMAANRLSESDASNLREGERLYIPGVERDQRGRVRRRITSAQRRALQRARQLGLGSAQVARALLHGRVEQRWIRAAARGRRNRMPGTLRWPITRGWFVRGFGSGEGGYHLAVDIMGRIGWNVRASAAGIVGYAGDEVRGYGNMVILIHPGGWVTMYAHNSVNLVVAGQRVPAGAIIAEVGSTGISRGPHVHYEFIYDGRNCDPAPLFRPGVRHRSGNLGRVARETWTDPDERPEHVECSPRRRHPRSRWVVNE